MEEEKKLTFVCISDTHTYHDKLTIPEGDVLIHSGDFSYDGSSNATYDFIKFLQNQPHKYKVVIAGNHDLTMDTEYMKLQKKKYPLQE